MRRLTEQDWFPLADLALAGSGAALCYILPRLGGWPLLLCLLPWLVRLLGGRFPFKRTALDIPILVFLITALIAAWAAYNPASALAKLWLLVGGILLFYALAGQQKSNLWSLAGGMSVLGALVAVYFLFTADWRAQPADIGLLNRLGDAWMSIRPGLGLPGLQPNRAGGLIVVFIPFSIALGVHAWQRTSWRPGLLALSAGGLSLLGLLFSSSRAAWLALFLALALWGLWAGISSTRGRLPKAWLVASGIVVCLAMLVIMVWVAGKPALVARLVNLLPGPDSAVTRMEIYANSLRLVSATPLTGGGLASFAGLYSRYILLIPNFLYAYCHNLYLDVILEQGVFGLTAYLVVLGGSFWLAVRGGNNALLRGAALAGLAAMALHGLADDPFYGVRGTPLLLMLPGLVTAIDLGELRTPVRRAANQEAGWIIAGVLSGLLLVAGFLLRPSWLGRWYADQGALAMARVELRNFPSDQWDDGRDLQAFAPAEALFDRALQYDGRNLTANYRLGLIALLRRDFPAARAYLEAAYALDHDHRGVLKALGYCYTWLGMYDQAASLLQTIPEARQELATYTWWWGTQNRPDLAQRAEQMVKAMH